MSSQRESFSIKNWSEDDRPREKLLKQGRAVLTNAELVAILIGSGNRSESAVDLSKRILASVNNNLQDLGKLSIHQLMQFKGIGEAKAITIAAALELGRRRGAENVEVSSQVTSSKDIYAIMHPILADLDHEQFWIIYLNHANKVVHKMQLSKGGISQTIVDTRLVLKKALELNATGIILTHNHPSGTLKASKSDIQTTEKLQQAAKSMDMRVLDHLIITDSGYYSFADSGLING
ncbi:RadC family protein [Spongiivirga citrea]|uniref:DNA repair protein RadC n=1 Tax=Spongiivirga citrea TaxID=1481457 RepID=A0A6M0CFK0_9FLAO|nr:DNA repair protein RadC [Spongiivirga citrea]NER16222.1 DNA repair protein RadC [Spongiivirga citrea]